jgi:Dolichyl-phosphate-mannose-protein mannosyltransferase
MIVSTSGQIKTKFCLILPTWSRGLRIKSSVVSVENLASIIACLAGIILLLLGGLTDWLSLLTIARLPQSELSNPWIRADLVTLRTLCVFVGCLLVISPVALWTYPLEITALSDWVGVVRRTAAARCLLFVLLSLTTLVLMKTVLQLCLFLFGYAAYGADDFSRTLSADYWLYYRRFDLGWEGWLGLGGSGWLPFSDYLFGLALAVHRDLYLTPRMLNLVISAIAVLAAYLLGRELFGRTVGLLTASLFAFQPWHLWLGVSGMTSDLPSVVLIGFFGLFLLRWLRTDRPYPLVAASGCLGVANGFRYENWFFAAVFSLFLVANAISRWRRGTLVGRWVAVAVCALVIVNLFPVIWMIASYVVLGDWLPALHVTNAWMVAAAEAGKSAASPGIPLAINQSPFMPQINMLVLALGAFPIELCLSFAGIAVLLRRRERTPSRQYLFVLLATLSLFAVVFKGRLPASIVFARYLLPFLLLLLPYAGFALFRLLDTSGSWRAQAVVAACLVIATTGFLDLGRAFNYPAVFPKDAIAAGWTIRRLQENGNVRESGKILIDRRADWGDLGIVALANRPERFVLINERAYRERAAQALPRRREDLSAFDGDDRSVRGSICDQGFAVEACKKSVLGEGFDLVVLSSPTLARSFQDTFHASSWVMGDFHIFTMKPFPESVYTVPDGLHQETIVSR